MVRPVGQKGVGTNRNFSDTNGNHWRELYKHFNVTNVRYVHTVMGNEEIAEYYNAGFVANSRSNGLFQQWGENFEKAMRLELISPQGVFFTDQTTLATTISAMNIPVKLCDKGYNYPVLLLTGAKTSPQSVNSIDEVVHVHYHHSFKNPKAENPIYDILSSTKNGFDLNQKIEEFGLLVEDHTSAKAQDKTAFSYLKGKMSGLRKKLNL